MDVEVLSAASESELEEMSRLHIPFMKELDAEIQAQRNRLIHWDVLKVNNEIMGCHRTVLLSGWGFLYGVYVRPTDSNIWTSYKLVQHTVDKLSSALTEGFITWIDHQPSWKSIMMKRLSFIESARPVHRLFFEDAGLRKLLSTEVREDLLRWRMSLPEDCQVIEGLAQYNSSFINSISLRMDPLEAKNYSGWLVGENDSGIVAAVRWFIYGDTLFLMFTLSMNPDLDITPAVIKLLAFVDHDKINTYRVNLEYQRKITLLRLSGYSPYTNESGHETNYLSKQIKGTIPCEHTN